MSKESIQGYHTTKITKGTIGESSKIQEELAELLDAEKQENKILALNELADIIGSIDCYLLKHFPQVTLFDLVKMARLTKKVFLEGYR